MARAAAATVPRAATTTRNDEPRGRPRADAKRATGARIAAAVTTKNKTTGNAKTTIRKPADAMVTEIVATGTATVVKAVKAVKAVKGGDEGVVVAAATTIATTILDQDVVNAVSAVTGIATETEVTGVATETGASDRTGESEATATVVTDQIGRTALTIVATVTRRGVANAATGATAAAGTTEMTVEAAEAIATTRVHAKRVAETRRHSVSHAKSACERCTRAVPTTCRSTMRLIRNWRA